MRTHKFVGATSREVLHKVKQALGDDALILSNRSHEGGIEIVALSAADANGAMDEDAAPAVLRFRAPAPADAAPVTALAAPAAMQAPAAPARVAPAAAAAPAIVPVPVSAPVAAPPVVATSAITASASTNWVGTIPALARAAVTHSTASPAVMTPPVAARPTARPDPMSWPAATSLQPEAAMPDTARGPASGERFAGSAAARQAPASAPEQGPRSIDGILSEIQNLKSVLQRDIAALATGEGMVSAAGRSGVMQELLSAGFSAQLSRQIADEVCAAEPDPTIEAVAECLERDLWIAGSDEMITRGGVYALVGPTGVGKTTTVAKLAARAVVRFGASKVALLTTDSYRVGAHDQLRIYGRILNVPVHAVRDAQDLATALAGLSDRHLILIDTIGMSQRDRMVAEQAAMLAGCGDVKRLLLVQTTANARTLEQVVSAYKKSGVDGCILTKTDEAASIAPALDVVIRHQLPLHYVTDGQRVPEDLQLPDAAALVLEALKPSDEDAFELRPDEMAFMMPAARPQAAAGVVHG